MSNPFAPRQLIIPSNPDAFRTKITTEPNAIINLIVGNNPVGVADNLDGMGLGRLTSPKAIKDTLLYLLNRDPKLFVQAVNVKLDPGKLSDDEKRILVDVSKGVTNNLKSSVPIPAGADTIAVMPPSLGGQLPTSGSANATDDEHWYDVATNLGNMAANLWTAIKGGSPSAGGTGAAGGPPPPAKDRTWMWVGIGVGIVILVTVLILVLRKKK